MEELFENIGAHNEVDFIKDTHFLSRDSMLMHVERDTIMTTQSVCTSVTL